MKVKKNLIFRREVNVITVEDLVILPEIVQEDVVQIQEKDIIVEEDIEIVEVDLEVGIIIEEKILDILILLALDQEENIEVIDIEEREVVVVILKNLEIEGEEVEIK